MAGKFKYTKYFILSFVVILVDQVVKLLVHYNMVRGSAGEIPVIGDWFKLHYTLNPGMAFGIELGFEYDKLVLTLFRLVAMCFIAFYLYLLAKRRVHSGLLWSIGLILGGAVGNVVDSIFYGKYLGLTSNDAPTPWFHGKVVDMFYLDIWEGQVASWVPFIGGDYMSLWPIFNVADAAIFVGVATILIMQRRFFSEPSSADEVVAESVAEGSDTKENVGAGSVA
ncbi:lipoprotein signal peptidase [Roseivirga sp. BDSF3-8]|uniref:lipoprotein signal peptidase n=1 Tax=Roseivirga sp. BDSF3-8 TaxID=3241598 RepID=UPI003531ADCE